RRRPDQVRARGDGASAGPRPGPAARLRPARRRLPATPRPGYAPPAAMTPEGGHDRPRPGTVISRAGYPMGGVISRGGVARGPGAGQDRKQDVRGVPGVM